MKTSVIRTRIDDELKNSFEAIMDKKGLTISKVLRNFIADYVGKENLRKKRELETIEALEEVKLGNAIDGEIVMNWLKSWGTNKEEKFPL